MAAAVTIERRSRTSLDRVSRVSLPPISPGGLALRAALAVSALVGFYALGAGIVLALLGVGWAEVHYRHTIGIAGIACGIAALWVAWALLPPFSFSRAKDARPPKLADDAHPRLRRMIEELARKVGEQPPDDLYLLPDANAFAGRDAKWLGLSSRRVLGIGLPLLATLDVDEVRSVLAHELGHHRAGDVRFGPWIYRTRLAIARALERLDGSSFWLHLPFALYGRLYLRLTLAASREQEIAADALAAKVAGASATARALAVNEVLAPRWQAYFYGDYVGLLARGAKLPLLAGFDRFAAQKVFRPDVVEVLRRTDERRHTDMDTHPPLEARLEALGLRDAPHRKPPAKTALELLDDGERAERDAIDQLLPPDAPPLRPVAWDDVAEAVWLPYWREMLKPFERVIGDLDPSDAPKMVADLDAWIRRLRAGVSLLSPLAERKKTVELLGLWLTLALHDEGFDVIVDPGADAIARAGTVELRPEAMVRGLAAGELSAATYAARLGEARTALRALGAKPEAPAAASPDPGSPPPPSPAPTETEEP
jgi:Zn-dependent protease with chaperone function